MVKNRKCKNSACVNIISQRNQRANIYCSAECNFIHKSSDKINDWLKGVWDGSKPDGELSRTIRKFLIDQANNMCSECSWDKINPVTGKCPIEVDHIDGNSTNNSPENLKVLCPNCHSLTPTYKALNKNGRGNRAYRKKYNQFNIVKKQNSLNQEASKNRICNCGNSKSRSAKRCSICYKQNIISSLNYPPIEEIIQGIEDLGCSAYSKTLGKSDNAVRNYLKKNNVKIPRQRAPKKLGV